MNTFIDSLNLRPQEKRVIFVVGVIVFVVLNWVFVWPKFGEYGVVHRQLAEIAYTNSAIYQRMIDADLDPTNGYKKQLVKLQRQESASVKGPSEIQLQKTISDEARPAGMDVNNYENVNTSRLGPTNQASQFFENQQEQISVSGSESNIVKFLYNIGNDPAMIRVKQLNLFPGDANRYTLKGQILLTADYKKAAPVGAPAAPHGAKPPAAGPPATGARASAPAGPGPAPQKNTPPGPARARGSVTNTPGKPGLPAMPTIPDRTKRTPPATP